MKRIIIPLFVILSLAFAPVGQAMAGGELNQMEMDMAMGDGPACDHHIDMTESPCTDADCHSGACFCCGSATLSFFMHPDAQASRLDYSVPIRDKSQSRYLSQIPRPLFRPPMS